MILLGLMTMAAVGTGRLSAFYVADKLVLFSSSYEGCFGSFVLLFSLKAKNGVHDPHLRRVVIFCLAVKAGVHLDQHRTRV